MLGALEKDLKFISEILGKDFLDADNIITDDQNNFKDFENELSLISQKNKISKKEILKLSMEFSNLNKKSLKHMLSIYPTRVKNIAERLNKDIYELVSTNEKLEKLKEMVPEFNHNNIKEEKSGK